MLQSCYPRSLEAFETLLCATLNARQVRTSLLSPQPPTFKDRYVVPSNTTKYPYNDKYLGVHYLRYSGDLRSKYHSDHRTRAGQVNIPLQSVKGSAKALQRLQGCLFWIRQVVCSFNYLFNGADVVESGYVRAKGKAFIIDTPGRKHHMISIKPLVNELNKVPVDVLSLHAVAKDVGASIHHRRTMLTTLLSFFSQRTQCMASNGAISAA